MNTATGSKNAGVDQGDLDPPMVTDDKDGGNDSDGDDDSNPDFGADDQQEENIDLGNDNKQQDEHEEEDAEQGEDIIPQNNGTDDQFKASSTGAVR
jgi:hypothetical protein